MSSQSALGNSCLFTSDPLSLSPSTWICCIFFPPRLHFPIFVFGSNIFSVCKIHCWVFQRPSGCETNRKTPWLMQGRGRRSRNAFQIDSFFRVLARVHMCSYVFVHAWSSFLFFSLFFNCLCVEWLPVWACCEASEPNHFPPLILSRCSSPAQCSPAAIQFRQIPTGIQLKFLPNNQLSEALQTACLQLSSRDPSVIWKWGYAAAELWDFFNFSEFLKKHNILLMFLFNKTFIAVWVFFWFDQMRKVV